MSINRKNIETLLAANKAAIEGMQNDATLEAALEKALADMSKSADMVTKSSNKAVTVANQRTRKSQNEIEASSKTYAM
jgi:hypothetical protein